MWVSARSATGALLAPLARSTPPSTALVAAPAVPQPLPVAGPVRTAPRHRGDVRCSDSGSAGPPATAAAGVVAGVRGRLQQRRLGSRTGGSRWWRHVVQGRAGFGRRRSAHYHDARGRMGAVAALFGTFGWMAARPWRLSAMANRRRTRWHRAAGDTGGHQKAAPVSETQKMETELAESIFEAIDADRNGLIARAELKSALQLLGRRVGAADMGQREDGFFFAHARLEVADWKTGACERILRKVTSLIKAFLDENGQDTLVEYAISCDLMSLLDMVHHLGLDETVVPMTRDAAMARADFLATLSVVCEKRIGEILHETLCENLGESCSSMSLDDIGVVEAQLQEQHYFPLSMDVQRICMRMHGTIGIEEWKSGVHELLGGYGGGLDGRLLKNPELGQTLKSGIPLNEPFDFSMWECAQDQSRFLQSIAFILRRRSVVSRIAQPLLLCILMALLLDMYNNSLRFLLNTQALSLPLEVFTLTAGPLGLLLVFRTNGAYARYDEARKIWGDTLNRCRDLARQACWMRDSSRRAAVWRLLSAFGILLRCHLRKPERHDEVAEVGQSLSVVEIRQMKGIGIPPPLWVLNRMAWTVDAEALPEMQHMQMSQNISELIANIGKCERLLSTPMPLAYSRLTTRFLFVWLLLLPFFEFRSLGGAVVFGEAFIAFFLLELEDIGHQIEEPFSVLPLEKLSGKITAQVGEVEAMWEVEQ